MRTLFPNEATLGPTLGWLSKVSDQAATAPAIAYALGWRLR